MRALSVNLNQRVGNPATMAKFMSWLGTRPPDVVLAQEPFRPSYPDRPELPGYCLAGTTPLVSCWVAEKAPRPQVLYHADRWLELRFGSISLHNVYLSPDHSSERTRLLTDLATAIAQAAQVNVVVLGDFNLAPRPEDGLFGGTPSKFTRAAERHALAQLLSTCELVDATRPQEGENPEFTFERVQRDRWLQFRCDLALVSKALLTSVSVGYDHTVRRNPDGFTDHSAILVDGPSDLLTPARSATAEVATKPKTEVRSSERRLAEASHKTAMRRGAASQIARRLHEQGILKDLEVKSVLDYGCGHGKDVEFYRSLGYKTEGYDVEPAFGWTDPPGADYDLVTLVFVVNVLPSPQHRLEVVQAASRHLRRGGHLLIAARSEAAIAEAADAGRWVPAGDGYLSSPGKGTFQKGIGPVELGWLLGAAGLQPAHCTLRLSGDVSFALGFRPV